MAVPRYQHRIGSVPLTAGVTPAGSENWTSKIWLAHGNGAKPWT